MAHAGPPLGRMLGRYWLTVFPLARMELRRWSDLASRIPDPHLRRSAQWTLEQEHLNAEGAALFATLVPWSLGWPLLRALVAFQTLFDYLDTITEEQPDQEGTRHLHRALLHALDPTTTPAADWYARHPFTDDGGYVDLLAERCRSGLSELPRYAAVAPSAMRLAVRAGQVQALNHERPSVRAELLREWADTQPEPADIGLRWWEHAAAASSSLGIFVLLALAGHPAATTAHAHELERGYCTSLSALNTLLESLVDLTADRLTGDQSLASYYAQGEAAERLPLIAGAARQASQTLPHAERHQVVLAGMVAFYLSKSEAWQPEVQTTSRRVLTATGAPVRPLMRVLRLRRLL